MSSRQVNLDALVQTLDRPDRDRNWLKLLLVLLPLGVADTGHLQAATGLSRDQVNRILKRFEKATPAGSPILARVKESITRAIYPRRAPVAHTLAKNGAALLRKLGHEGARACALDATLIAHALTTLDVRLAALSAGLQVQTERPLPFGDGRAIRPDNLIALADGTVALFESEQLAHPDLLRRILEGLRNKLDFFRSPAGSRISPTVRVLFNLKRNREWDDTLALWERAVAMLAEGSGGQLPFRLLAMPISEFAADPDWGEPPAPTRWEDLLDPARLSTFGSSQAAGARPGKALVAAPKSARQHGRSRCRKGCAAPSPPATTRSSSPPTGRSFASRPPTASPGPIRPFLS